MSLTVHYALSFSGTSQQIKSNLSYARKIACKMGFHAVGKVQKIDFVSKTSDSTIMYARDMLKPTSFLSLENYGSEECWRRSVIKSWDGCHDHLSGWFFTAIAKIHCEPMVIGMLHLARSADWVSECCVKTYFSENIVFTHDIVCRLLRELEAMAMLDAVYDESGYFDHQDCTKLIDKWHAETALLAKLEQDQMKGEDVFGGGTKASAMLTECDLDNPRDSTD